MSYTSGRDEGQFGEWDDKNYYLLALLPSFSACPEIRRVILFGSRARGDYEERSDIDLAIDVPGVEVGAWDRISHYVESHSKTLLPIETIWLQRAGKPLVLNIEKEGVVLYERKDEAICGEP